MESSDEIRSWKRHRHERSNVEVVGPTHDVLQVSSDRHFAESKPVCIGMPLDLFNLSDDDARECCLQELVGLDFMTDRCEHLGELGGIVRWHGNELLQPAEGDLHRNCSSTRRSLSKKCLMCPMPCRTIASLSTPTPNAKPDTAAGS